MNYFVKEPEFKEGREYLIKFSYTFRFKDKEQIKHFFKTEEIFINCLKENDKLISFKDNKGHRYTFDREHSTTDELVCVLEAYLLEKGDEKIYILDSLKIERISENLAWRIRNKVYDICDEKMHKVLKQLTKKNIYI